MIDQEGRSCAAQLPSFFLPRLAAFCSKDPPPRVDGGISSAWTGPIGIGESLSHRVEDVFFETREEATTARTTAWYAYLIPSFDRSALDQAMRREDPGNWWEPPSKAILVGDVRLSGQDANLVDAIVHLSVPRISTGRYHLMLCNAECRMPLGDVIPQRVDVAADAFSAQLARKLERTTFRLTERLQVLQRRVQRTRIAQAEVEASVRLSREAVTTLSHRVSELERDRSSGSTPWGAFAGWFLAGASLSALGFLFVRRRTDASTTAHADVRVPDDPRELIESR